MITLRHSRWRWVIILAVAIAAIGAAVIGSLKPTPGIPLTDLTNLDELKMQFNQDKGKPRLLLLLSPT